MSRNPLRRISVRLTLWYSGMLLLLAGLLGGLLYVELERSLRADLDQQLRESAQSTLALVELEHGTLVWEGRSRTASPRILSPASSRAETWSASSTPRAASSPRLRLWPTCLPVSDRGPANPQSEAWRPSPWAATRCA
jgi:hypothetical protein